MASFNPRRRRSTRGLTLLEVIVVLAILVLAIGVAIGGFSRIDAIKLRTETNKLAAAIRHTFNRAAAHGLYMRMVFDLDAEAYWVEASDQPVFLPKTKATEGAEAEKEDEGSGEDADGVLVEKRKQFQEDGVIPRKQFAGGLDIAGVLTTGQNDMFRTGKAYLYFFPDGRVEPAMIYTHDQEDTWYTLQVQPFTGRVQRSVGKVDPPRDFGEPDHEEEESF
jgi:prepilin-type N-terminal cleavage/methylation domain-containing protein